MEFLESAWNSNGWNYHGIVSALMEFFGFSWTSDGQNSHGVGIRMELAFEWHCESSNEIFRTLMEF